MRGRFVVVEGVDGSGKTTQAERLRAWLERAGRAPLHLREPGSTPVGERLRSFLLAAERAPLDPRTEALLFFAARNELLRQVVAPALAAGRTVLCERFTPSTLAYQGQNEETARFVLALDALVVPEACRPDLVLVLDLDPAESLRRAGSRGGADGFEARGAAFLEAVRGGYHRYAAAFPERTVLLDVAGLGADAVEAELRRRLAALWESEG